MRPSAISDQPIGPQGRIAAVEPHDGRVAEIRISETADSHGVIVFESLTVYHEISSVLFEVWQYEAELHIEGVELPVPPGPIKSDDYLMDGVVIGADGDEIEWVDLLTGMPARLVKLVFFSGSEVSIPCRHVLLRLTRPLRKLEEWHGPLAGPDPGIERD